MLIKSEILTDFAETKIAPSKFLEHYGEVSMLDIKGADASKAVLVIGIMTLHSFGEGSCVGVSFAGSKGLTQGLLVTLVIAIHNIPEGLVVSMVLASHGISPRNAMLWNIITSLPQPIVAVPAFLCADTFHKLLPFCTGFAAGCMIWMIIAEVLPDAFKVCSLDLQEGDTIVMGSDGLFNNVFDQEIISTIYKFEDVNSAANELASLASGHSNDTNFDSLYSIKARNRGFDVPLWKKILGRKLTGGKPDDITVIVGQRGRWINRRMA